MGCNDYNSNCKDSCDQIDGLFEAASNLVQYRDIIEKWLHGGQDETVTIGGKDVSTLLGLIAQIKQLIGVLPDGKTIILDDVEKVLSVFLISGGGIRVKKEGGLYVDVDDILVLGGGLAKDEEGKIFVDFSQMPTDKFETLLKQLRIPIWFSQNTYFYVNGTTGSDTLDDGRGLSAEKPFKTIQACINYVCDTYNFSVYDARINISAGTYTEWITIPNFSTLTGQLRLRGAGAGQTTIRGSIITKHGGSVVALESSLTVQCPEQTTPGWVNSWYGVASFGSGAIDLACTVDAGISNPSLYKYNVNGSQNGGELSIVNGANLVGNTTNFLATIGSSINIGNDFSINGSIVGNGATAVARNGGKILVFTKPDGVSFPIISGSVVGSRYYVDTNAILNTAGRGPNFFPGTIDGTVDRNTGGVYA